MSSRLRRRSLVTRLYECYIRFELPLTATATEVHHNGDCDRDRDPHPPGGQPPTATPRVTFIHPPGYNDPEMVKAAAKFAFPLPMNDDHTIEDTTSGGCSGGSGSGSGSSGCGSSSSSPSLFTFVLTSASSEWTFGYVRSSIGVGAGGGAQIVSVFLTLLPYQELFFKALNRIVELGGVDGGGSGGEFLDEFSRASRGGGGGAGTSLPEPGTCFNVGPGNSFVVPIPDERRLPEIPANRHLSEFFAALSPSSMLAVFQSLLAERRIVVVSRRLSRLSSVCLASALFLYPMHWQHIFIPCLPHHLIDYLSAPMPFIIGLHSSIWNTATAEGGSSCVVVDADADAVLAFEEDRFPPPVEGVLLEGFSARPLLGDGLARCFLRGLAMLMGHWQDAVLEDDGGGGCARARKFDDELFTRLAHPAHRPYIRSKLLRLQIFRQFIEERLDRLQNGGIESDEFEREAIEWRRSGGHARLPLFGATSQNSRTKRVLTSVKRESNQLLNSVKHNSALKSALRSVKEGGKSVKQKSHGAITDIKSKFHVPLPSSRGGSSFSSGGGGGRRYVTGGGVGVSRDDPPPHLTPLTLPTSLSALSTLSAPTPTSGPGPLASSSSASTLNNIEGDWNWGDGEGARARAPQPHPRTRTAGGVSRQPRLSRSEENLIDLDSGSNPLYELINIGRSESGNVFEDWENLNGGGGDEDDDPPPPLPVIPPPRRSNKRSSEPPMQTLSMPTPKSQNHSQSLGQLLDLDLDDSVGGGARGEGGAKGSRPRVAADDMSLLSEYGLGTYFANMNLHSNTNSNSNKTTNYNSGVTMATKTTNATNATTPSKSNWATFE